MSFSLNMYIVHTVVCQDVLNDSLQWVYGRRVLTHACDPHKECPLTFLWLHFLFLWILFLLHISPSLTGVLATLVNHFFLEICLQLCFPWWLLSYTWICQSRDSFSEKWIQNITSKYLLKLKTDWKHMHGLIENMRWVQLINFAADRRKRRREYWNILLGWWVAADLEHYIL